MTEPRFRSRSYKRKQKKLPGGETVKRYKKKTPGVARCSNCGKNLKGIPRKRPHKMRNMGKTEKRPERPHGGKLCSECSRKLIKEKAREISYCVW